MRPIPILTSLIVLALLYLAVFERDVLTSYAQGEGVDTADLLDGPEAVPPRTAGTDPAPAPLRQPPVVRVVAVHSTARDVARIVELRGDTQPWRRVDVRAETSGKVISEPLSTGAQVGKGDLLCRIDPGTREVALAEAEARLAEAKARVPAAEAQLAEARAQLPAAEARIGEAEARVPAAEAALAEATAGVAAAEARLAEARARVPEAEARLAAVKARRAEIEARVAEARTRLEEARVNLKQAQELFEKGFASETRVLSARSAAAAAEAALQGALSQLQSLDADIETARSQLEAAKAGVQTALSALEGARAGVKSAESGVASARAGVVTARSQLESARAGVRSAEAAVENAKAGVKSAEAAVAAAERELERTEIRSPIAGILEADAAETGTLLQPGSVCATVIQLDPIRARGFVPEFEIGAVTEGAPAEVRIAADGTARGSVVQIGATADPQTRTFLVEVTVENPDLAVRAGQTAEIRIAAGTTAAHLLPQSALTLDEDGRLGVRVVDDGQKARFVPVEVIRDTPRGVVVVGLPEAADVIVIGQEFVTDGVVVEPVFEEVTQ